MELIYGGGVYFKRRGLIIRLLQNKRCDVRIRLSNKYVFYLKKKKKNEVWMQNRSLNFFSEESSLKNRRLWAYTTCTVVI